MFIVYLRFSTNRAEAASAMAAHNDWIAQGFAEGVFHCVGSLTEGGGAIIAAGETRAALEARIRADPFVQRDIVTAEIAEVEVKRTSAALDALRT